MRTLASGDAIADRASGKSYEPFSTTGRPGKNISECSFGVSWV